MNPELLIAEMTKIKPRSKKDGFIILAAATRLSALHQTVLRQRKQLADLQREPARAEKLGALVEQAIVTLQAVSCDEHADELIQALAADEKAKP